MRKRVFVLIAVMGIGIALAACSGKSKENVTDEESTQKQPQALVIEDEKKDSEKETEKEAEKETDENKTGSGVKDSSEGEAEQDPEDWSDFTADTVLVDENEVGEKCIIFNDEYYEYFRLDYNHKDEVAKIEFYELLDQDKTMNGDYSDDNRKQYDAFYGSENEDLEKDELFIKYSVPEIIPNLVVRFTSKGGNVKEYYVAYNGRDGGANLIAIEEE